MSTLTSRLVCDRWTYQDDWLLWWWWPGQFSNEPAETF